MENNLNTKKKAYNVSADKNKLDKNKLDKTSEAVKADNDHPYDVRICDIWGTTSKEITTFGAKRFIEGANVYLVNEKLGFKEYMPIDDDDYKLYTLDSITKKIKTLEKELGSEKKKQNPRSIKSELRFLKNRQRSLEVQGRGSYMRLNQQGKPFFEFDRVGNFKVPVFKNVDYSTLDIPSETRIKTAAELLQENDDKNGEKNLGKIFQVILIILMIVLVLAGLFFAYKTSQMPQVCAENFDSAARIFNGVVNKLDSTVTNLQNLSSVIELKPQDVIIKPNVSVIK